MQGLDKFLTEPPCDGYLSYWENVRNHFAQDFYDEHEMWCDHYEGQCDKWIDQCYWRKGLTTTEAAKLIQRAHSIYKL